MVIARLATMLFFTYLHPHEHVQWSTFRWNLLFIVIDTCFKYLVLLGEEEICEDGTAFVRNDEMDPYTRIVISRQSIVRRHMSWERLIDRRNTPRNWKRKCGIEREQHDAILRNVLGANDKHSNKFDCVVRQGDVGDINNTNDPTTPNNSLVNGKGCL